MLSADTVLSILETIAMTQEYELAPFFSNGIDGTTGNYLLPPYTPKQIADAAAGEQCDSVEIYELRAKALREKEGHYGPRYPVDAENIQEAGWGIIYAPDIDEEVKEALSPLLRLRKEEAGDLFQDFPGERAFRPNDTKNSFLTRCQEGPNPANPEKVPYYVLLVGSPGSISYRFQSQLDVQRAVGRVYFESADEYASYADSVVKAAKGHFKPKRRLSFFGVRNRDDPATEASADLLISPLLEKFLTDDHDFHCRGYLRDEATKAKLENLLGGDETPSLLFSASHGMGFQLGDERQLSHQGALLCQDWPGHLKHKGPIPPDFYLAGEDISENANVQGLIAFFFACYGGGTPQLDEFAHRLPGVPPQIAPYPFLAALPKRLLGHPNGGALAVIAHVDRAWTYSFIWGRGGRQLTSFEELLKKLVNGKRVGSAMEAFGSRYAELSAELLIELEDRKARVPRQSVQTVLEDEQLAGLWAANNDARNYIVLGDPAVRLPV